MNNDQQSPQRGMTTSGEAGTIFAKLAKVMGQAHRVPKNGHNRFNNYKYATESDAADEIRPLLAENGLGLMVSVDEVQEADNGRVIVYGTVTIGDESGAWISVSIAGEARDVDSKGGRQDKGTYKAITGAVKYWLFKTFLLSTGDDPETDAGNPQGPSAPPVVPPEDQKEIDSLSVTLRGMKDLAETTAEKRAFDSALNSKDADRLAGAIKFLKDKAAE